MPTWTWALVTVVAGLSGGLITALWKRRHDREDEHQRRIVDAAQSFAEDATQWFDAVSHAIDEREEHLIHAEASQQAFDDAATALQDARRLGARLQVAAPWQSEITRTATVTVVFLQEALDELRDWPPQDEDEPDDEESDDKRDSDADASDYDATLTPIEEACAEARMKHELGLAAYREFLRLASTEALSQGIGLIPTNARRRRAQRKP